MSHIDDLLVELGNWVALLLPRDPHLRSLGYERAVTEVESTFRAIHDFARKVDSLKALVLRLLSYPEHREWYKHVLVRRLGQHINLLTQSLEAWSDWAQNCWEAQLTIYRMVEPPPLPGPLGLEEVRLLLGYVHWSYVALMPHWRFAAYPFRGGWRTLAALKLHYRELPPELRGAWLPEIPEGWVLVDQILHHDFWVYVIETQGDEPLPIPEGWEEVDFEEGVVQIWHCPFWEAEH